MSNRRAEVESEIARRLVATQRPDSPNQISADTFREWAIEYLDENDAELRRFPDLAGKTHWNLWMMEARFEDALFAVLIFQTNGLEFGCGTGNAFEIKAFAERDFPDNPDEVLPMIATRFSIPRGVLHLERQAAEEWLGRGW